MHMSFRVRQTISATLLAGTLACGGGGDETGAGATEGATGGTGSTSGSESTASPTSDPTTTGVSQSGTDTSTSGSSSESGPTSEPDATTGGESDTGPATVPDTDPDPDTGFTETTVDPDTGESTGGGPSLCPPEPNDDDCAVCNKQNCCDELMACQADEGCGCISACVAMGGTPMECGMQCMVNPMQNDALKALRQCNQMLCEESCMMP